MAKGQRLVRLLTLLQGRRRAITASALAEQLEVSERTIYRDIQALIDTGAPIRGEAGVGFLLGKGCTLSPLIFNEEELEALILGARMVKGWGDSNLGISADNALSKILAVIPDQLHYLRGIAEETLLVPEQEEKDLLNYSPDLRSEIRNQDIVRIKYTKPEHDTETVRKIWPLGLTYWGKVWTLIAWCELRNDYRVFRLDRIDELSHTNETFEPTAKRSLKHYLETHAEC